MKNVSGFIHQCTNACQQNAVLDIEDGELSENISLGHGNINPKIMRRSKVIHVSLPGFNLKSNGLQVSQFSKQKSYISCMQFHPCPSAHVTNQWISWAGDLGLGIRHEPWWEMVSWCIKVMIKWWNRMKCSPIIDAMINTPYWRFHLFHPIQNRFFPFLAFAALLLQVWSWPTATFVSTYHQKLFRNDIWRNS